MTSEREECENDKIEEHLTSFEDTLSYINFRRKQQMMHVVSCITHEEHLERINKILESYDAEKFLEEARFYYSKPYNEYQGFANCYLAMMYTIRKVFISAGIHIVGDSALYFASAITRTKKIVDSLDEKLAGRTFVSGMYLLAKFTYPYYFGISSYLKEDEEYANPKFDYPKFKNFVKTFSKINTYGLVEKIQNYLNPSKPEDLLFYKLREEQGHITLSGQKLGYSWILEGVKDEE